MSINSLYFSQSGDEGISWGHRGVFWRLEETGESSEQLLMKNAIEMNKKLAKPNYYTAEAA